MLFSKIISYFNFKRETEDFEEIHSTIQKAIIFKGTNLWILVFAVILASIGLNMNSSPVVIGAMLISPLMGPINGLGYSIAINDSGLFRKSLKNFGFAIFTSLVASTLYFAISPVSQTTSEILLRTSPSIYDALIAIFGGLAGIIATVSKQKGTVIPGVAIATALMPPLCTAGFGLATVQLNYLFGAMYLFTINSVCIAISATFVSQLLKFPIRRNISNERKNKINRIISLVLVITIVPSIYLGYKLIENEKFNANAKKYIQSVGVIKDNYLLKSDINPKKKEITLSYAGMSLTKADKDLLTEKAKQFSLEDAKLNIDQGFSFETFLPDDNENDTQQNLKTEVNRLNLLAKSKQVEIDSITSRLYIGQKLLKEIQPLYPQIHCCTYGQALKYSDKDSVVYKTDIIIFETEKLFNPKDKSKLERWIKSRLDTDNLQVYFERMDM